MLEYRETMWDVTEEDINYLNAATKEVNDHFGKEVVMLKSNPELPNCDVDIYLCGTETYTAYSFECTEMYLKGMRDALGITGNIDINNL